MCISAPMRSKSYAEVISKRRPTKTASLFSMFCPGERILHSVRPRTGGTHGLQATRQLRVVPAIALHVSLAKPGRHTAAPSSAGRERRTFTKNGKADAGKKKGGVKKITFDGKRGKGEKNKVPTQELLTDCMLHA